MSYILEALKKSESERGNTGTPTFQTVHTSSVQYQRSRNRLWPALVVIVVLLNMLILGWLVYDRLGPSSQAEQQLTAAPAPTVAQYRPAPAVSPPTQSKTVSQPPTPPVESVVETTAPPQVLPTDSRDAYRELQTVPRPAVEPDRGIVSDTSVSELYDLPADVRAVIPELDFSAHVYSTNPQQRSVVINGDFMEEGDMLTSNLQLEEITTDGVIMDYRGTRFRSSVVSGWNID